MTFVTSMLVADYRSETVKGVLCPNIYSRFPWNVDVSNASTFEINSGYTQVLATRVLGGESHGVISETTPIAHGDNAVTHAKSATVAVPKGFYTMTGERIIYVRAAYPEQAPFRLCKPISELRNIGWWQVHAGFKGFLKITGTMSPGDPYGPWTAQAQIWEVNFTTHELLRTTLTPAFQYTTPGFTREDCKECAGAVVDEILHISNWYVNADTQSMGTVSVFQIDTKPDESLEDPSAVLYRKALALWPATSVDSSVRYYAQGQIATRTAEQAGRMLSNNSALILETIQLVKDIAGLLHGDTSLIQKLRSYITHLPEGWKGRAKLLADLRLSEQYGVKLTIQDFADLISFTRKQNERRDLITTRTSATYGGMTSDGAVRTDEHWKCWISQSRAYAPAIAKLFRDDLVGFQNVWDLIPYSFVVDWLFPVGDILQDWDDELMLSNMSIDAIVVGTKRTCTTCKPEGNWSLISTTSCYTRERRSSFPPSVTKIHPMTDDLRVVLNGAALIVQRLF